MHSKLYWNDLQARALGVITEAVDKYNPSHIFAMFSGGHDSLTATRIASKHPNFSAAVHINTGIGIPETREFVRETCKREGWPLKEYRARDYGQNFEDLVTERGFPGPGHHYKMYHRLKERCIRALVRDHKVKWRDRIIFSTGCRSQESTRRMGHVERIQQQGVSVWVAPIHDWSKTMCNEYIEHEELEPNQVVKLLHMSGECLCGAFAHKGELKEIELWYPKTAEYIKSIEEKVRAAGFPWGWEEQPPKGWGSTLRDTSGRISKEKREMLCTSCNAKHQKVEAWEKLEREGELE